MPSSPHVRRPSLAGLWGAAILGAAGFSPSLLPRSALIAGLLAGVAAAVGYGLGTAVAAVARRLSDRRIGDRLTTALSVAAAVLLLVGVIAGWIAQRQQADLMATPPPGPAWMVIGLGVGAVVTVILVVAARGIRGLTRALTRFLDRTLPRAVASIAAATVVALVAVVAVRGLPAAVTVGLNGMFTTANDQTTAGLVPPSSPVVTGSPRSVMTWASLGHDGRDFIGGVTPRTSIAAFTGAPARDPIRVYAGLEAAPTATDRAALAVRDLDRFDAWDRAVVAIGTSTGTGTVDEGEVAPLEYMYGGDVATVSTQYSVLPSFLSFLVDQANAKEAAVTLFDAIRTRWSQLPEQRRPRLVVFGESLGAFGADAPFEDLDQMVGQTGGALFEGPPNATALWQRYTDERDAGSLERLPVYREGQHLRWADDPADYDRPTAPWQEPRIGYLQNASDPVVWWSPQLLWSRPDWLAEPRGPDVLPQLTWIPGITFLVISGDMINSQSVPQGHGHVYGSNSARAWARIIPPAGWTDADTDRLAAVS